MCTALLRVRGTLVRRGPWVIDGQLLLGTIPALRSKTSKQNNKYIHINIQNPIYTNTIKGNKNVTCGSLGGPFWFWHFVPSLLLQPFHCKTEIKISVWYYPLQTVKCVSNNVLFMSTSFINTVCLPVSKATTLEEEIATGHSTNLTWLLQPVSQWKKLIQYIDLCKTIHTHSTVFSYPDKILFFSYLVWL